MTDREQLDRSLADYVLIALREDIAKNGEASLLVSGGSTPQNLFKILSRSDIDWSKVNISLVDERFVPAQHADRNEKMVRELLLINKAAAANFFSLVLDENNAVNNLNLVREQMKELQRPFTVVILGMGEDGHTASLFPDAPQLDVGMDLKGEDDLIVTKPKVANHERITFTRPALLHTRHLALHCFGEKKKEILEEVNGMNDYHTYPIEGFIHQDRVDIKLYWSK